MGARVALHIALHADGELASCLVLVLAFGEINLRLEYGQANDWCIELN